MNDQAKQRLRDALAAAEAISEFLGDTAVEGYRTNFGLRLQIERLLEIVGEALNQARAADPEIQTSGLIPELHAVVGMRNRIVHGYDRIDDELIWLVANFNIPILRDQLRDMLD
ncbi:MAG: DUF86 domain-containing protein [Thermomicrobiales bacterium]|nr:DUF86 domain-containing protein [Thermomicrobiales bacterium]